MAVDTHNKGCRNHTGLRVKCLNSDHQGCNRYRSLAVWVKHLGERAAVEYLETWLSHAHGMSAEAHKGYYPKLSEVRSYIAGR